MTSAAPAGIAKRGSIPEAFAAEGAAEKTLVNLPHTKPCGSGLAREEAGTDNFFID